MASRSEVRRGEILGPGPSRSHSWLRERRVKIALGIASVEGLLIVIHAIGRWPAIIVAGAILVAYLLGGRSIKSDTGYQIMWIIAASQALVALVPLIWWLVSGVIAIIAVAALAVVALVFLLGDKRSAARS